MIASVVVTLDDSGHILEEVLASIRKVPCVEVGEFLPKERRLPLVIDSSNQKSVEATTQSIQEIPGVIFLDLVFVHFEDGVHQNEHAHPTATIAGTERP